MKIVRNILAFIAGAIIGGVVNMAIVMISGHVIPPPEGADVTTMEGLKASIHLFQPQHFIMPFLAHAIGTLIGALVVASLAINHKLKLALGMGVLFLIGGVSNVMMLPSPLWFNIVDLGLAYIPMGFVGGKIGERIALKRAS